MNQIIGNAHLFTAVMLKADGTPSIVQMNFTDDLGCIDADTGPAVHPCSVPSPCAITDVQLNNPESCDDNGTPTDPTDDFYIADIFVFFENPPSTGLLKFTGADFVDGDFSFAIANVLSIGSPFGVSNKKIRADGQTTSFVVEFTDASGCIASLGVTGVDPCSFPAPLLTCPPHTTVSCFNNVPLADPSDVLETHECPGNVDIVLQLEVNQGQTCPNKLTVVRIYQATDACGQTATCSQFITVDDQTDPTMTCPGNVTVSCASNVPPADIAAVTNVGDNCGGTVTVFNFPQDAISNQSCTNRFTITRSYFAVDECGNSKNCIQIITVNDQTKPTMTCPGNLTLTCANQVPAANTASVTGVGDNCGGTVTVTNFPSDAISNQTCANRFNIMRSYFAVDVCGNSNNCTQIITVNDQTPAQPYLPGSPNCLLCRTGTGPESCLRNGIERQLRRDGHTEFFFGWN
ncbi:MAG: hypothetical protein IPH31_17240 [Lewinellaceae bacterium]|nr:hypothetical protein [Lewinellaceae bacterium]